MRSICVEWLLQKGWGDASASSAQERTLHERLCGLLRDGVESGALRPGQRLPSSRELMSELGISRNTVSRVYEQLRMEGYVHSQVGSGTYVENTSPDMLLQSTSRGSKSPYRPTLLPVISELTLADTAQAVVKQAAAGTKQWGAFMPGVPDVAKFPRVTFARILNRLWRNAQPEMLTYGTAGGAWELKQALADYLRVVRSVNCEPEQILITEGVHQAIDLTSRTLTNPGNTVWMEDPGYWGIANVLRTNPGINVVGQPVDAEGMILNTEAQIPRLIFVTPSHQYPLGNVMSLARRKALLAYAREHNAWIVEDDYDSEFRFGNRPIPSMQGLEPNAPVIYIGTFSKTMFPSLRVGYMVLPPVMIAPMQRMHSELYRAGHTVTQMAVAEFIQKGYYAAHIRRMRVLYGRRREWLRTLILRYLGENFLPEADSQAGLHIVLRLPSHVDDVSVTEQLQSHGVLARPLSKYYQKCSAERGLLLGYGSVPGDLMQPAFFKLLHVLRHNGIPSVSINA